MPKTAVAIHLIDFDDLSPKVLETWTVEIADDEAFTSIVPQLLDASRWEAYHGHEWWDVGLIATPDSVQAATGNPYFTPEFIVRPDGALEFVPVQHGVKLFSPADVERTINAGFIEAEQRQFVVFKYPGIGGSDAAALLLAWLLGKGFETIFEKGLGFGARVLWQRVRHDRAIRRARVVAEAWVEQRINSPYQLRVVVDLRDAWNPTDIAALLRIDRGEAKELLKLLGYVPNARSEWQPGTSKKARDRREKWIAAEPRDRLGNLYELHPRGISGK